MTPKPVWMDSFRDNCFFYETTTPKMNVVFFLANFVCIGFCLFTTIFNQSWEFFFQKCILVFFSVSWYEMDVAIIALMDSDYGWWEWTID